MSGGEGKGRSSGARMWGAGMWKSHGACRPADNGAWLCVAGPGRGGGVGGEGGEGGGRGGGRGVGDKHRLKAPFQKHGESTVAA